jgi:hypothetical protein
VVVESRHVITFGAIVCILAMLAYVFVFADAPPMPVETAPAAAP